MVFVYALLCFLGMISILVFSFKKIKKNISVIEIIIASIYVLSLGLMFLGLLIHDNQYYTAIDPVGDECYIPFGGKHIVTLIFYFVTYHVSLLLIWIRGDKLPPLTKVLSLSFLTIGIIANLVVLMQLSKHNTQSIDIYDKSEHLYFLLAAPIVSILVATILIIYMIKNGIMQANEKIYSNQFLNKINLFLAKKSNLPFWSVVLILPLLLVVTCILILFGQDSDSLIKVFTETTTWRFSQQMHPPILDHKGHYLCTVAASGSPNVVKPIRFGKRNGKTIIVNRQLLIANAFEEMIENFSSQLHQLIRSNYDKYGHNLSRRINSEPMSNLTYLLMKPLEWIFLICLYLFCEKPEEKIKRQYQL